MAALWRPGTPRDYTQPLPTLTAARRANAQGANILIRPQPTSAHPWLLLDDLPVARLLDLIAGFAGMAVQTSPDQGQAWLLADRPMSQAERGAAQRLLVQRLGADLGAAGGGQFGRLPGFRNKKLGRDCWTNLIKDSTSLAAPISSARLLALDGPPPAVINQTGTGEPVAASRPRPGAGEGCDESNKEFAFACHKVREGWARERIEQAIAAHARARGKRRGEAAALAYARATVRAAARAVGI